MSKSARTVGVMVICAVVILSVLLLSAGCAPAGPPPSPPTEEPSPGPAPGPEPPYVDEWNLPSMGVLAGMFAWAGLENKWVMDLAAEEINAAGGIRGIPVRIDWYDSRYDTATAVQQMNRILDTKPLVIAGLVFDCAQHAALPMAADAGVFVLDSDGDPGLFPQYAPWGVTLMPTVENFTPPPANYYVELHGDEIESVAIFINLAGPTHERQANCWRDAFQARGITVHPYIECPTEMVDFGSVVLKAMGYGADAFINIVGPDQAAKIDIELYQNGMTEGWRIVNYLGTNLPPLYEIGEGYLEDTYTYSLSNPYVETEKWLTFLVKYREWQGDPEGYPAFSNVWAYDILFIIKEAFEAENITGDPAKLTEERIKIRDYINSLASYEGLQGEYRIVNSTALQPLTFFQIKDNRPMPIATLHVE